MLVVELNLKGSFVVKLKLFMVIRFDMINVWLRSPLEKSAAQQDARLRRAGAQGGETILWIGFFRPWLLSVRPPGSARTDQVLEDLIIC